MPWSAPPWAVVVIGCLCCPRGAEGGERLHAMAFLGWGPNGDRFVAAEVLEDGEQAPIGSVQEVTVEDGKVIQHRDLPEAVAAELAEAMLQSESGSPEGPALAKAASLLPGVEDKALVRNQEPLPESRLALPDGQGWMELHRTGGGFEILLLPRGTAGSVLVRRVEVGKNPAAPAAFLAPGGKAVALSFCWAGKVGGQPYGSVSLEVIRLSGELAKAYNEAGLQSLARKEYPDGAWMFQQAMRLDPGFVDPAYNLARLQALQGDSASAVESLRLAFARGGNRVSRLARREGDFASLRELADFQDLLFGHRPGKQPEAP